MKRLIIIGFTVLSSLILISCTTKDVQPEGEIEEPPTVTKTFEAVVEITATKTSTLLPTETPQPTATSTPEKQVEVELLESASYFDISGDFVVIGLIKNTGQVPIDYVWITVTARDTNDAVVATRESLVKFNVVLTGEIVPFYVYFFDDVPDDVIYEVEIEADVASDTAIESTYRDFETLSAEGRIASGGYYYEILGEVRNSGEKVAETNTVHVMLFNSEGDLIGYTIASTLYAVLPPGSTSPFEFILGKKDMVEFEIDRFEIIVEGRVSEQPVVEEPVPESEEIFKLVDVNGFPVLVDFSIVGLLQNISDYDLEMVSVSINLRDPAGKLIMSDSGLTLLWDMPAGEILPFEIMFIDIPTVEIGSIEVAAQGRVVSATSGISRDFEIVTATGETTEFGSYNIEGEIKNLADSDVERIRLAGVIFNSEGKILSATLGYLDTDVLAAGEVTGFEVSFTFFAEGEVDHFEFYVLGYELEEE